MFRDHTCHKPQNLEFILCNIQVTFSCFLTMFLNEPGELSQYREQAMYWPEEFGFDSRQGIEFFSS